MIRREVKDGWIIFTQFDHSVLSGEIMRFWGNQTFHEIDPDPRLIYAIANHDRGWREWDSYPRINPENHLPASFIDMYPEEQHVIWSKCFEDIPEEYSYSSALIALHFSTFNNHLLSHNPESMDINDFKNKINSHVSAILKIDKSKIENNLPDQVQRELKYIQIGDIISLTFCNGWDSVTVKDVPVDYNGNNTDLTLKSQDGLNYTIDPYPFSVSNIEFNISGLEIMGKEFGSDTDLRSAIKKGKEINFKFSLQ